MSGAVQLGRLCAGRAMGAQRRRNGQDGDGEARAAAWHATYGIEFLLRGVQVKPLFRPFKPVPPIRQPQPTGAVHGMLQPDPVSTACCNAAQHPSHSSSVAWHPLSVAWRLFVRCMLFGGVRCPLHVVCCPLQRWGLARRRSSQHLRRYSGECPQPSMSYVYHLLLP